MKTPILIFLVALLISPTLLAQQHEIELLERVEKSLQAYCENWAGCTFEAKIQVDGLVYPYTTSLRVGVDETGRQARVYSDRFFKFEGKERHLLQESINLADSVVFAEKIVMPDVNGKMVDVIHVRAQPISNGNGEYQLNFEDAGYLLGISEFDGKRFSQMLHRKQCEIIEDGDQKVIYRFTSDVYGCVELQLESELPYRVSEIVLTKTAKNRFVFRGHNPILGNNTMSSSEAYKSITTRIGPITYTSTAAGLRVSATVSAIELGESGTERKRASKIELTTRKNPKPEPVTKFAEFEQIQVLDHTPVHVYGQGANFKIVGGQIFQVK